MNLFYKFVNLHQFAILIDLVDYFDVSLFFLGYGSQLLVQIMVLWWGLNFTYLVYGVSCFDSAFKVLPVQEVSVSTWSSRGLSDF